MQWNIPGTVITAPIAEVEQIEEKLRSIFQNCLLVSIPTQMRNVLRASARHLIDNQ